jgi:hypothetical protein
MNNSLHEYLNKLRIIAKVKVGQRLNTVGEITIHEEGYFSWFVRKFYRDGKNETTRFLQDLFRSLTQSADQLQREINTCIINKENDKLSKCYYHAVQLAETIKHSVEGINNLAKTYRDYPKTAAELEGIIHDYAVVIYSDLLKAIPANQLSKDLKDSILYDGIVIYQGANQNPPTQGANCHDVGTNKQGTVILQSTDVIAPYREPTPFD